VAAPACSPVMTSKITNYGWSIRLIDPRGELSVPPEEELRAAPPVLEPEIHGPVPERSVLVAPLDEQNLDALVALAGPLARSHPSRGVILARLLRSPRAATGGPIAAERELVAASQLLDRRRAELVRRRIAAGAMACISPDPGRTLSAWPVCGRSTWCWWTVAAHSLARASLEVIRGPRLRRHPPMSPAWWAREEAFPTSAPTVRWWFPSEAHDWAALELGAHVASTYGAPIRLLGRHR